MKSRKKKQPKFRSKQIMKEFTSIIIKTFPNLETFQIH